jgi:hypothetical protein
MQTNMMTQKDQHQLLDTTMPIAAYVFPPTVWREQRLRRSIGTMFGEAGADKLAPACLSASMMAQDCRLLPCLPQYSLFDWKR